MKMKANTSQLKTTIVSIAYESGDEVIGSAFITECKKLELDSSVGSLFTENPEFVKKTWWNTWGKKASIILFASVMYR